MGHKDSLELKEQKVSQKGEKGLLLALIEWRWHTFMLIFLASLVNSRASAHTKGANTTVPASPNGGSQNLMNCPVASEAEWEQE